MSDSPPVVPDAILPATGDGLVQSAVAKSTGDVPAGGVSDSPALTPKSRSLALIAKCDEKIRRKATDIVLAALRAPETSELPEDALQNPPQGWTKRSLRVALDATNSMKAAPAYLGIAQRIVESYKKAEADKQSQPVINAELVTVTVNQQVNNYPVRVLEED